MRWMRMMVVGVVGRMAVVMRGGVGGIVGGMIGGGVVVLVGVLVLCH